MGVLAGDRVIEATRKLWQRHATKLLGGLAALNATGTAVLAVLSASPDVRFLMPPRQFAYLAITNAVIGVLTIKRGYTNTRNLKSPDPPR